MFFVVVNLFRMLFLAELIALHAFFVAQQLGHRSQSGADGFVLLKTAQLLDQGGQGVQHTHPGHVRK